MVIMKISKPKKIKFIALIVAVCILAAVIIITSGVFQSKEIVSVSVTYDQDPYNEGQSNPHTYAVTSADDIAFLEDILKETKWLMGGAACPFKQIILHVAYVDGRKVDYFPACDSCETIAKNDPDNGENHFALPIERLYEFRQKVSKYIPELKENNWWLDATVRITDSN
jgi:hypothetical protein